jgi:YidC/Oxa1 family membrane protein insertase
MEYHYGAQDLNNGKLQVNSYIGPIDMEHLNQDQNKHLVQLFGFGWFFIGYLGKVVMWLLTTLYSIIPNYGIVCILFAFIIRIFTGPLTKKSFLSNQKMQAIQPKLKKIQEKHKDNKGQLNKEIMRLYKKEGVNPLGGCLPILIQMPLLIALFQVFRKTIEFRGASFLPFWITDLSQPDVVVQFAFLKEIWGINYFFGHGIALLPFIMGVVMFLNMKMTATNNVNSSQTSTMYIMNGFFILLFNTFPSGLNLYYTVYNILNFLQQRKLQKLNS